MIIGIFAKIFNKNDAESADNTENASEYFITGIFRISNVGNVN
jgi:hypothetical protein